MTELTIREYRPEDIPALTRLWMDSFGDSEKLISEFFRLLPDMGTGLVAQQDGKLIGMAYAITGMELLGVEEKPPVCGYIYAVAVDKAHRGLGAGRILSIAAADKAKERGAGIICTLPAEPSLYKWYEEIISVQCALYRRRELVDSAEFEPVMELSSTEYMLWRENMLKDRPHLHLSNPSLEFQRILCREYGGGFYAVGSGIAAAYRDGDMGIIRELICPPQDRLALAASIGSALGTEKLSLFEPCEDGDAYIAASRPLPSDCLWNLSFD